jgi:hypothetical protein
MAIKEFLTLAELAEYLRCPRSWLYDHAAELPHIRRGQCYLFWPHEVEEELARRCGGKPAA